MRWSCAGEALTRVRRRAALDPAVPVCRPQPRLCEHVDTGAQLQRSMGKAVRMNILQQLISEAIALRCTDSAYVARLSKYPRLAELAPGNLSDIVNDTPPWFCHGLGIRLALWRSESGFSRFEKAIDAARRLPNFDHEWRSHWGRQALLDYERYFHLLWMLQCAENLVENGLSVRFAAGKIAAPDLAVDSPKTGEFFY